jgi:DNA repair protein RadA/Sms
MAKPKTAFFCSNCGQETSGWMGKCPGCGSWNTIVEEKIKPSPPAAGGSRGWFVDSSFSAKNQPKAVYLSEIEPDPGIRFSTGIGELDRVLGGGFVAGSIVLVGGDPGIGKSTLLMQVCGNMSQSGAILYVSGEESAQQIRLRSDRLGILPDSIRILQQTAFVPVVESIQDIKPVIVVIDSIQTLYTDELSAPPGSVSQVREVTSGLLRIAKSTGTVIVLIGHVTKDGAIAGPRVLEHMVDTVLYFESGNQQPTRILRAVKNRFGTTDEIGLFEMTGQGLATVQNASAAMLEGRPVGVPGTAVTACMEGTRPILIEIQALLSGTAYPAAQRMTQGLDRNRVSMILAVLEKQLSAGLYNMDAFVNII